MKKYILIHVHSYGTGIYHFKTDGKVFAKDGIAVSNKVFNSLIKQLEIEFDDEDDTITIHNDNSDRIKTINL